MKSLYFLLTVYLLSIRICFSQWSNDPNENNIVCLGLYNLNYVSDMNNGIIAVGQTHPVGAKIYVQRVTVDGRLPWAGSVYGVNAVDCSHQQWLTHDGQTAEGEFFLPDGEGGCFMGYGHAKFVGYFDWEEFEIYDVDAKIQRIDSLGNRFFGPTGIKLMPGEPDSTGRSQFISHWCLDGYGGLYVIWKRYHGVWGTDMEKNGVYIARVNKNGQHVWGPNKLSSSTSLEYIPYLDSNLNLNLYYYPGETHTKIPDQFYKISAENGTIINEKEIEIGTGEYGFNTLYDYCTTNNYSAIFAFRDFRASTLRIQKLDSDGDKLWGDEPIIITQSVKGYYGFDVESDKHGGAYVFYITPDDTFHLVHLNHDGIKLWEKTFNSILGFYKGIERNNEMISVAPNGDIFVLIDQKRFLTKLSFEGEVLWDTNVTTRNLLTWYFGLQADNIGGCIVMWHELGGGFFGFRAQRVNKDGKLGGPTSVQYLPIFNYSEQAVVKSIYPNPFNNSTTIKFSTPHLDKLSIKIHNILGKEVRTLISEEINEGEHSIQWNGTDANDQQLSSGVFLVVLQAGTFKLVKKTLLIK